MKNQRHLEDDYDSKLDDFRGIVYDYLQHAPDAKGTTAPYDSTIAISILIAILLIALTSYFTYVAYYSEPETNLLPNRGTAVKYPL